MSKTKYIEYAGRGFWAYDVAAGIFLKYLIDAAEASDHSGAPWLLIAVSSWRVQACVSDFGLTLDADWEVEQWRTFLALAEESCSRLEERRSIPAEEIVAWPIHDELRIFPRGEKEVPAAPVVELGRAIIALVSGDLPDAPPGKAWVYGAPTGRTTVGLDTP